MLSKERIYTIGISCIGSGVGQSVVSSCNLSGLPLRTIGFGTNPYAFGAYDCDVYDYLPGIYDSGYLDALIAKCIEHRVDLLIPGLDDEAFLFARNLEKLDAAGFKTLVSGPELMAMARNKGQMCAELSRISDSFVKSFDKKDIAEHLAQGSAVFPLIAKPYGGCASRGVSILLDEHDLDAVSEGHIIQELAIPSKNDPNHDFYMHEIVGRRNLQVAEISIQVVVGPNGEPLGRMSTYNKLNNGVPIEVTPYENKEVWAAIDKLMPKLLEYGLRGPLNIQGRMTDNGFRIFEMNPRFTGITGLRALFGFNEVEACIKSWLGLPGSTAMLHPNFRKFGLRQMANKALSISDNPQVAPRYKALNPRQSDSGPVLLVSGANGFLGRHLVWTAAHSFKKYKIITLTRDKCSTRNLFASYEVSHYDYDDLAHGVLQLGQVDTVIHCAFARPHRGEKEIAESLVMTADFLTRSAMHNVPRIINLSSQSVYGNANSPPWSETMPLAPNSPYAQAKLATEIMLSSLRMTCRSVRSTSIRLGRLAGYEPYHQEIDLLSKFVRQLLKGEKIAIAGGEQEYEKLDVRDAAEAVLSLLDIPAAIWKPIYNIGSGAPHNIKKIAYTAIERVKARKIACEVEIDVLPGNDTSHHGLDCDLFRGDTGWSPSHSLDSTVDMIIDGMIQQQ